ncbi:hypothetical protein FB566_0872 [Stackebrandtia endophytica]|uniref:Uncharacterized protein n=1 Tax=Stackebrandtia endophytica TaxID=1496996 RepID=A0A543AS12_9ACTN|nr:DUF6188 family protein [Stackebrandtia endophytica]TQL75371.1 hypothetical protein FB566_0872 [Stackebrandtia endophytica]
MLDLTGQTITEVTGDGQLSIHTDGGWLITIESRIVYKAEDGTTQELTGEEPETAAVLAPVLTGHPIQTMTITEADGLTMTITPNVELTMPPDEDFEAWNIVGPTNERIVSMPGGELVTWNPMAP